MRSKTLLISKTRPPGQTTEPSKNRPRKSPGEELDRPSPESKSKPKSDSSKSNEFGSPENTGNESETYAKPKRKIVSKTKPDTPIPSNEDVRDSDLETIMG